MSYVYFIQAGVDGPVKIGLTDDPPRRLAALQVGNAEPLAVRRLIRCGAGAAAFERFAHTFFTDLRLTGEWFSAGHPIMASVLDTGRVQPGGRSLVDLYREQQTIMGALGEAIHRVPVGRRAPIYESLRGCIQKGKALLAA